MNTDSLNNIIINNKNIVDDIPSDRENIPGINNPKNNNISLNENYFNKFKINNIYEKKYNNIQTKNQRKQKLLIILYLLLGCILLVHSVHYLFSRNLINNNYYNIFYF